MKQTKDQIRANASKKRLDKLWDRLPTSKWDHIMDAEFDLDRFVLKEQGTKEQIKTALSRALKTEKRAKEWLEEHRGERWEGTKIE